MEQLLNRVPMMIYMPAMECIAVSSTHNESQRKEQEMKTVPQQKSSEQKTTSIVWQAVQMKKYLLPLGKRPRNSQKYLLMKTMRGWLHELNIPFSICSKRCGLMGLIDGRHSRLTRANTMPCGLAGL